MSIDRTKFDEKFAALRQRFRGRLVEYADELDELMAACPGSDAAIADLIHRIAGTAGSFGFGQVSASAAVLDEQFLSSAKPCDSQQELSTLTTLMRAAAQ